MSGFYIKLDFRETLFLYIVFFPFPQLSQILSDFYFHSGKEKGGQMRWKGLHHSPSFFVCVFFLGSSLGTAVQRIAHPKDQWSLCLAEVTVHQPLVCCKKPSDNSVLDLQCGFQSHHSVSFLCMHFTFCKISGFCLTRIMRDLFVGGSNANHWKLQMNFQLNTTPPQNQRSS